MDQLTLSEKIGSNYMYLDISGALNSYTLTEFQEKVYSYIPDFNVVVKMEEIIQIDSSGVGVLLAAHNEGLDSGTKFYIMSPSEPVRHALDKTGFMDMLNIIHSVTEVS